MPLLGRETELSPQSIFELSEADQPWWVAHTRSRQEKSLARYLLPLGVPFFVPQHEKKLSRGARRRSSYLPLFPGYVFFRGSLAERQTTLQSRLIVQILEVQDQRLLQKELLELHALKESGATLIPFEELHSGDPVQVTEGPFQGYSGVVVRGQTRLRLLISITMLRKTVAVEFDRDVLRAVPIPTRSLRQTRTEVA
jgi:transcription antitermination factor NusG